MPKAPEPMMVPRRSSDSLMSRSIAMSGLASLGVNGWWAHDTVHFTHWLSITAATRYVSVSIHKCTQYNLLFGSKTNNCIQTTSKRWSFQSQQNAFNIKNNNDQAKQRHLLLLKKQRFDSGRENALIFINQLNSRCYQCSSTMVGGLSQR